MGLSLGGSYGSSKSSATGSNTTANTYSGDQSGLQSDLGKSLSTNLKAADAGSMTPGVVAQKTAAADTINKTSSGLMDRVQSFLSARGFGKSGAAGQATLQSELGRESDLAANEANFAGVQQGVNTQNLMASLNYAFQQLGMTEAGSSSGKSSGYKVGVSAGFGG